MPCHNEEANIAEAVARITKSFDAIQQRNWILIVVDDGSNDGTREAILKAHLADTRVRGLVLSRNFGHQQAITAAMAFADGDYVGIMDGDLQDPVEELVAMFQRMTHEKLDVCYGVRRRRVASPMLRLGYRLFYRLLNFVADRPWPLDAGDFCILSKRAFLALRSMPERERILRGMRSWIGFKQLPHPYDRPERHAGTTKYNFGRLMALARKSIIAFSVAPLRFASWLALVFASFALLLFFLMALNRFAPQISVFGYNIGSNAGTMTVVSIVSLSSAASLVCLGIIGEYLALIYEELKRRPVAVVGEKIGHLPGQEQQGNELVQDLAA